MAYIYNLVDTWNDAGTTYTGIGLNVTDTASNAASLLMDLQVGGASKFKVAKDGVLNLGNGSTIITPNYAGATTFQYLNNGLKFLNTTGVYYAGFADSAIGISQNGATAAAGVLTLDVVLRAAGAGSLALGAFNTTGTTAPTPQSLSVQSWASSTTSNQTGANFTINGSQGTGTGAGGSIIFRVAPAGGTSNGVQNALATALTIASDRTTTLTGALTFLVSGGDTAAHTITTNSGGYITFARSADVGLALYEPLGYVQTRSDGHFGWTASSSPATTVDLKLSRDDANKLALRNGANAQTFNLYGTYSNGGVDYERLAISASTTAIRFASERAGSGANRYMQFTTSGGAYFDVVEGVGLNFRSSAGTNYWQINSSGHLLAGTDNLYDIGAAGATRPRDIYLGGKIVTASVQAVSAGAGIVFRNNTSGGVAQVDANGAIDVCYNTTLPAGGTAGRGIRFSSNVTNMGVFFGSGAPTLSAAKGSLYLRSDGTTTNDRMYVNTDGATTWTAVTTAA